LDAWDSYKASIVKPNSKLWDYVVLTAANEMQAEIYREHIESRLSEKTLPKSVQYIVVPDPKNKRVGSGGATLNVLRILKEKIGREGFKDKHILCIHSGGDSKRIPQYSACGKLFSPVPRKLPDGRRSTLFDEIVIWMTSVPPRITDGILICSGDALLMFNSLQIDFYGSGAAAISFKQSPEVGKHHGVYVSDNEGNVSKFLHKQSVDVLRENNAFDKRGKIDIDTGAVILSSEILEELFSLIDSEAGFAMYVNEDVRLSFYADFLFPLASSATLEQYIKEKSEGVFCCELIECRKRLWDVLSKHTLKLIRLAPASFIHFGTTKELMGLMTVEISNYRWLDWAKHVLTNFEDERISASNSFIEPLTVIGENSYIEDSLISENVTIGNGCVISCCELKNTYVPSGTVLHGLKLKDGRYCVRMYGVEDNPKEMLWFGKSLNQPLWEARLHPVRETMHDAINAALSVERKEPCFSLKESFEKADTSAIRIWQAFLHDKVQTERLLQLINKRIPIHEIPDEFLKSRISEKITQMMLDVATSAEFSQKIRIYYYLAFISGENNKMEMLDKCFDTICHTILAAALSEVIYDETIKIAKRNVKVELPLRVNFGGGWSDTPPYCMEHGGNVLNAAITVNDKLPVEAEIKHIEDFCIICKSVDDGSQKVYKELTELQDCNNPYDVFALHKAALITCGVIPYRGKEGVGLTLGDILKRLGGGFQLSTGVYGIPRGSGLGTSSILAGACAKAILSFFGIETTETELYNRVLCMEQIMSTGGGWQDQVGGLVPGIKMVRSSATLKQEINLELVCLSDSTYRDLDERFCLIYTGQRRLARNLLREVVGNYLAGNPESIFVLEEIQKIAEQMKTSLEIGDVNLFAELLDTHWELSKRLDSGSTNTCIEQLLLSVDDMLSGRMICGAGGGGFLQVILKKGVTREMLSRRLGEIFGDCGVDVWKCGIIRN